MSKQLLITLPDDVYMNLSQIAEEEERELSEIIVEQVIPLRTHFYVHPRRAEMQMEVAAYHRLHPKLVKTHLGKTVAVHGGEVVDYDDDPIALLKRIRKNYPDEIVLRRLVEQEPERELRVRSFHYLR